MRLKPLVDVVVDHKNVNSALVVDGYQCIDRSLSKVKRGRGNGDDRPCLALAGMEGGQGRVRGKFPFSKVQHGIVLPSPVL